MIVKFPIQLNDDRILFQVGCVDFVWPVSSLNIDRYLVDSEEHSRYLTKSLIERSGFLLINLTKTKWRWRGYNGQRDMAIMN